MKRLPALIGLTGYARSGKDTAAEYLALKYGFERQAFADTLRRMAWDINPTLPVGPEAPYKTFRAAESLLGYEAAKADIAGFREFLKGLGAAAREHLGEDVWVDAAFRRVKRYSVFSDVRFVNEANRIRAAAEKMRVSTPGWTGPGVILRIEREGVGPESEFEAGVDLIPVDAVIRNNGTSLDEFYSAIDRTMDSLAKAK